MKVLQKTMLVATATGLILVSGGLSTKVVKANEIPQDKLTSNTMNLESSIEEMDGEYWKVLNDQFDGLPLLQDSLKIRLKEDKTSDDKTKKVKSIQEEKEQIVIASVDYYLNIRSKANEDSKIVGKLYKNGVGKVLAKKDGWYKIKSGSVTGYVKGDYVLTGNEAEKKANKVGKHYAEVTTTTLKVREKSNEDSTVLTLVGEGEKLKVKKEKDEWVKVKSGDHVGYVSKEYVDLYKENEYAESIEEEKRRIEQEQEAARQAALEQEANRQVEANRTNNQSTSRPQSYKKPQTTKPQTNTQSNTTSNSGNASLGQKIANYALQFKGNPYVYGGTSLTNGADCSGFVMSVFRNFGIHLPRTSGSQGVSGTRVSSIAKARPGDLIAYSGHIGIYIGNNRLIHASTAKTGIIVSNVNYRPIRSIRRIV